MTFFSLGRSLEWIHVFVVFFFYWGGAGGEEGRDDVVDIFF